MNILHVAKIRDNPTNGVCVAVPEHVKAQGKFANVGLMNIRDFRPDGIENCFVYSEDFTLSSLPKPFDKPDLVVFHEIYIVEYLKISKSLRKQNIPYVIIPHGSLTKEAQRKKRLKKFVGNFLFKPFIKKAKAIQCLSKKEQENSKFNSSKFIGPNGCYIPNAKKESFNQDKISFVYVGRLESYIKGLDIMLDAFKMVTNSKYNDQCTLSMYGPDYQGRFDYVKQMIEERGIGNFVTLNPPVFNKEKENVLLGSDVFIQTSRTEGMPMGILEALSYGLPCLITEGTTLGSYIKEFDAGWVSKTNAQSVFEQIVCAIEERKELERKSNSAINLIKENFEWDMVAKDSINSYSKYIGEGER